MGDKEVVLLNWVKNQIKGYPRIEMKDFTASWQDGLAFCALIDSLRPGKINTKILTSINREKNLKLAFETAASLGVPQMLDESEILEKPDEDSIITYLTSIYHLLGEDSDSTKKDPAKEKLKSVQVELMALKEKLLQSKKALQEKETAKKRLEVKVDQLKNLLENEKQSNKALEDEFNRKIDKLKSSIATASEGTKAQLMEQLKNRNSFQSKFIEQANQFRNRGQAIEGPT